MPTIMPIIIMLTCILQSLLPSRFWLKPRGCLVVASSPWRHPRHARWLMLPASACALRFSVALRAAGMPHLHSLVALALRRERALRRGYVQPSIGPARTVVLDGAPRAKLMARSIELNSEHEKLVGHCCHLFTFSHYCRQSFTCDCCSEGRGVGPQPCQPCQPHVWRLGRLVRQ